MKYYETSKALHEIIFIQLSDSRLHSKSFATSARNRFSNVTSNDWYDTDVTDMAHQDYITGINETTYRPLDSLSLAAFFVMISR